MLAYTTNKAKSEFGSALTNLQILLFLSAKRVSANQFLVCDFTCDQSIRYRFCLHVLTTNNTATVRVHWYS